MKPRLTLATVFCCSLVIHPLLHETRMYLSPLVFPQRDAAMLPHTRRFSALSRGGAWVSWAGFDSTRAYCSWGRVLTQHPKSHLSPLSLSYLIPSAFDNPLQSQDNVSLAILGKRLSHSQHRRSLVIATLQATAQRVHPSLGPTPRFFVDASLVLSLPPRATCRPTMRWTAGSLSSWAASR